MTTLFMRFALAALTLALVACHGQQTARKSPPGALSTPTQQPTASPGLSLGAQGRAAEALEEDDDDEDDEVGAQTGTFEPPRPLSGLFPKPPELQPQVAFWRKVYGEWGRSQVAIHDDRYMNLVYEVVELPGDVGEGYTSAQKELVADRLDYWRLRLDDLERKLADQSPLDNEDQRLAARVGQGGALNELIAGASERVRAQRGLRERFKRGLEISGRYDRHFKEIFREAGLPEELAYLPHVESSFQANARSSAGAVGIWQFTPSAAKTFMDSSGRYDARLDPIASARGAARYLSHAYDTLGSWPLALTSYNHGIGGMKRAKSQYGHDFTRIVKEYDHPQFGFASRNYYAEFLAACDVVTQPERYFPEGVAYEGSRAPSKAPPMMLAEVSPPEESPEPDFAPPLPRPVRALPRHKSWPVLAVHGRVPASRHHVLMKPVKALGSSPRIAGSSPYAGFKTVSYSRADGSRRTGYVRVSSPQSKASVSAISKGKGPRPAASGRMGKVQLASRK